MNVNGNSTLAADEPINVRSLYYVLREKLWVLGLCAGLGAAAAVAYLLVTPKIYAAETIVQVEQAPRKVLNIQDVESENLSSEELLNTIEENLKSPALLARVIQVEKLRPEDLGLSGGAKDTYSQNELIRALSRLITAKLIRGTRLISVVAENRRPEIAQRLSNALVTQYKAMNTQQRLASLSDANNALAIEAARLKQKLRNSEQALQDYKERTQAVSLEETQNITVEKLKELNANLTAAKSDRLKLESDYAQAKKLGQPTTEQLLQLPSVAESKAVLEQKRVVAEQEGLVANLGKRYGPLHPKMIQAMSQLEAQRAELGRAVESAAASIGSAYEAARDTEKKLAAALAEQEQKALELNKLAIPYNVLQRDVESDRALYSSVVNRMKETDLVRSIQQDDITVKAPALLPDRPVKPHRSIVLAGAVFIALLLGASGILGLHTFDRSLRTVDEAERFLGLSALAVIPEEKKVTSAEPQCLMLEQAETAAAEGFRTLRTSLSLLRPEGQCKSVAIMSAVAGEGKTFCAVNYAVACAQQGRRTLLIDSDLRLRSLTKVFSCDGLAGVSDLISDKTVFDACIHRTTIDHLSLLPAGSRASHPLELLSQSGFGQMMEEAKRGFECIIVDTAPLTAVSDTYLVLDSVDSFLLVVGAGQTSREIAARALQKLIESDHKPMGFVLNRVPFVSALAGYYGYARERYGDPAYSGPNESNSSNGHIPEISGAEPSLNLTGYGRG